MGKWRIIVCGLWIGGSAAVFARTPPNPSAPVNVREGFGLHGYDPVSYFTRNAPIPGLGSHETEYMGVHYKFYSTDSLEIFKRDPDKYLPQFGGWCPLGMTRGKFLDIDPEVFKMIRGKLHLFYNGLSGNALAKWNQNESKNLRRAETQWRTFLGSQKIKVRSSSK